jgi:hypothetical protein
MTRRSQIKNTFASTPRQQQAEANLSYEYQMTLIQRYPARWLEVSDRVLFGLYSGQRLGDIAKLTRANIG